jgi:translocator protein
MKKFLFLIGTIITIAVNAMATLLPINNITTKILSDSVYPTPITPAGFTFSIWALIYTILLVIGLSIAFDNYDITWKTTRLYLATCLINCTWIFAWHYQVPFLPFFLLISLVFFNYAVIRGLSGYYKHGYAVYLGWTVIASVINTVVLLRWNLGIKSIGLEQLLTMLILMAVGVLIYLILSYKIKSISPLLVAIWAYYGITVSTNNDTFRMALYLYMGILAILCLPLINNYRIRKLKENNEGKAI